MIKIPRFMREYAAYIKKELINNKLISIKVLKTKCDCIDSILSKYKRGLISANETMHLLAEVQCGF